MSFFFVLLFACLSCFKGRELRTEAEAENETREPTPNYYVSNVNTCSSRKQSWRSALLTCTALLGSLYCAASMISALQESTYKRAKSYVRAINILIDSKNQTALSHALRMRHDAYVPKQCPIPSFFILCCGWLSSALLAYTMKVHGLFESRVMGSLSEWIRRNSPLGYPSYT